MLLCHIALRSLIASVVNHVAIMKLTWMNLDKLTGYDLELHPEPKTYAQTKAQYDSVVDGLADSRSTTVTGVFLILDVSLMHARVFVCCGQQ